MPTKGASFLPEPRLILEYDLPKMISEIVQSEKGEGPFSDAIRLSMWEAINVIAKLVVDETPVNLGHLATGISKAKDVTYGNGVWYGEVGDSGVPYAIPVEYGRAPGGKQPPVDDIAYWILRKQLQWYRTLKSGQQKKMSLNDMAWALAKHIAKEGTEGAFMFKKGVEAAKPHVDRIWANLLVELERLWNSGGK